jgi:gamma-glutamyltranspeptidase/glutathione hydrolase
MGVIEPMMNGMGGDLFAIVYEAKSATFYGLNASGWAPKRLTREHLRTKGITSMPAWGIDSVTIPGAVDGWSKLVSRFGRMPFNKLLGPAVHYARDGFPVYEWDHAHWLNSETTIHSDPSTERLYLIDGRVPKVGQMFRNEDLAKSLETVAAGGSDAYYKGDIARRIVALSKSRGGTMTMEDLADFSSDWVNPISTDYHGWTIYELPPNGQGIAALVMLNIMEQFPLAHYGHNSVDALHVMIESKKLAYADLLRYIGDPRGANIPISGLLSKSYAAGRAKLIDTNQARSSVEAGNPPMSGGDTTYLATVDQEGNMASLIQSNFAEFGSGLAVAGFVLQNRGGLFSLDPGSPGVLAGGKRPLHTIIPAFMAKGDTRIAFGVMGGFNQAQAHAQFVANVADYRMNIQAALERARFTKATFDGCDVTVEDRIPADVRARLERRGHEVHVVGAYSTAMGGGQATERNFATGVNFGASDPRKDGAAVPQQPPLDQENTAQS